MPSEDSNLPAAPEYQEYRTKCIQLLNDLIKSCPKDDKDLKQPGDNIPTPNGEDPKKPKLPDTSSTVLKHNGQVGSLEELIVFLIKAPTNNELKMKLNDVYKIFNPTARDIVSNQPPSA